MSRYIDLKSAQKIASQQLRWHLEQVSGAWSIDGQKFCKDYELDYIEAHDFEVEADFQDMSGYQDEVIEKVKAVVGITPMQERQARDKVADEWVSAYEESWFWQNIIDQIERELERMGKKCALD